MSFIYCLMTIYVALFLLENNSFLVKINRSWLTSGWKTRNKHTILCCRKYTTLPYPEEEDEDPDDKINNISKIMQENGFVYSIHSIDNDTDSGELTEDNPFYTLFWNKCPDCDELVKEMERRKLRFIFIDGRVDEYLGIFDEPLLYKNDEYIDGMFAIYAEIFRM